MHLNKILEQIKRHQSPSEAIDKLSTALEKHEGSLLEKGFTILKSELLPSAMLFQTFPAERVQSRIHRCFP